MAHPDWTPPTDEHPELGRLDRIACGPDDGATRIRNDWLPFAPGSRFPLPEMMPPGSALAGIDRFGPMLAPEWELARVCGDTAFRRPDQPYMAELSPDGRWLVMSGMLGFELFDTVVGLRRREIPNDGLWSTAFTTDGRCLVTFRDFTLRLVDLATGQDVGPTMHWPQDQTEFGVSHVAVSPTDPLLVVESEGGKVYTFNLDTGDATLTDYNWITGIMQMAFLPSGELLVADGQLWRISRDLSECHRLCECASFAQLDRGRLLAIRWSDRSGANVDVVDTASMETVTRLPVSDTATLWGGSLRVHPELPDVLLMQSDTHTWSAWRIDQSGDATQLWTADGIDGAPSMLPGGRMLVLRGRAAIMDVCTGAVIIRLHYRPSSSAVFTFDSREVVTDSGLVCCADTGRVQREIAASGRLLVLPDRRSALIFGPPHLWRVDLTDGGTATQLAELPPASRTDSRSRYELLPGGRHVLANTTVVTLRDGSRYTLPRQPSAFSPDGRYLVMIGGMLTLVDAENGRTRWEGDLPGSDITAIYRVGFTADSRFVAFQLGTLPVAWFDVATGRTLDAAPQPVAGVFDPPPRPNDRLREWLIDRFIRHGEELPRNRNAPHDPTDWFDVSPDGSRLLLAVPHEDTFAGDIILFHRRQA